MNNYSYFGPSSFLTLFLSVWVVNLCNYFFAFGLTTGGILLIAVGLGVIVTSIFAKKIMLLDGEYFVRTWRLGMFRWFLIQLLSLLIVIALAFFTSSYLPIG